MSRSTTKTTGTMSTLASVVFLILLLTCATVKSNEQDEEEVDQASIDTNVTDSGEVESESARIKDSLTDYNDGILEYTQDDGHIMDYNEGEAQHDSIIEEVIEVESVHEYVDSENDVENQQKDLESDVENQQASTDEHIGLQNYVESQQPSTDQQIDVHNDMESQQLSINEQVDLPKDVESQQPSTDEQVGLKNDVEPQQVDLQNDVESQLPSTDEQVDLQVDAVASQQQSTNEQVDDGETKQPSTDQQIDVQNVVDSQQPSTDEQGNLQNDVESQQPSTDEQVDVQKDVESQQPSTDQQLDVQKDVESQQPSTDQQLDVQNVVESQQPSTDQQLDVHNVVESQQPSTDKQVDLQNDVESQQPSTDQQVDLQNDVESQQPSTDKQVDLQNDVESQQPSTDEQVDLQNDVESQQPSTDKQLDVQNDVESQQPSTDQQLDVKNDVETQQPFAKNQDNVEPQPELKDEASTDTVSNFVRVVRFPQILVQGSKVVVEYHCEGNGIIVLDLTVMLMDVDTYFTVFSKAWRCYGQGLEGKSQMKSIRLRLPDSLAYRPDYFIKSDSIWQVSWCKLRAWLIDETIWYRNDGVDALASSRSRDIHKVTVLPPYSRPYKTTDCPIWIWPYVQKLHTLSDVQTCAMEQESVTLLDYPVAFNGHYYGVVKELPPFINWRLERDRAQRRYFPQFTIEVWVYILDYCPLHYLSPATACGLFVHMNSEGFYHNPAIFINMHGNVQIDVKGSNGFIGMKSTDIVPKNKWTRILFSFFERSWFLHVNYGPDLKDGFWTSHAYTENIYMDDTEGFMSLGGIDWTLGSFVGYMGRVVFYRRKSLMPYQLSVPDKSHPMFELHLTRRQEKCDNFLSWMDSAVDVFQRYRRYIIQQKGDTCPNQPLRFFMQFLRTPDDATTCPLINPHNVRQNHHVSRLLRKAVLTHSLSRNFLDGDLEAYSRNYMNASQAALQDIAVNLFEAGKLIVNEKGMKESRKVVHLLKQAACLGNDDAMYTLAVMLNNGVGCNVDEIQSLAFFMLGTLNRHLLSVMAVGHRHVMGIDGAPVDMDVAYMYYKQVADMTRAQKEVHKESGIATESIHLTDEARIEAQTSEAGELFLWLKNQAEKGVASAQSQLGTMLYHGAQGMKRNLQTAINMFRDGAELGNPDAMFNYGIMQYRGMGAEANRTEGKRMLLKAAELNNPNAVSALGWVALEVDKNYTQAVEMFRLAKRLNHMDSGYYLAFMHHFGLVPNETYNLDRAFEEYIWSAKKGQVDAGIMLSYLLSRGTSRYKRNKEQALVWARFIAEQNAHLAAPLRDALNAYRDGNYDLSLYLYLMLADTGLEVASFNLAYLCEHKTTDVKAIMSKECEWRHYNMSTQREPQFVDAYAYIKMGDYYWYGCQGHRNLQEAASHYSKAALKGNPQALFNLAFMVEQGAPISPVIWWMLNLTPKTYTNKVTLLLELYSRCQESRQGEAFIPCYLAWIRIWSLDFWNHYYIYLQISSLTGMLVVLATTSYLLHRHFKQRQVDKAKKKEENTEEAEEKEENQLDIEVVIKDLDKDGDAEGEIEAEVIKDEDGQSEEEIEIISDVNENGEDEGDEYDQNQEVWEDL